MFLNRLAKVSGVRLVRNPYQTCAKMLSLLRTHTEQLKWTSKRKKSMGKAVGKRMRGECPVAGAGAPGSGAPRIVSLTAFPLISCGLRSIRVALCGF